MIWIKKVETTPLEAIAKVIDSIKEQANDRKNAPSIHAVREALNIKWADIYPVGSIYMNVNEVDPSYLFGGTWQKIEDKFLLSSGTSYSLGATGGSATHSLTGTTNGHELTVEEMPSHGHHVTGGSTGECVIPDNAYPYADSGNSANTFTAYSSGLFIEGEAEATGGNQAHTHTFTTNNGDTMPPYLVVNVWKRTA